LADQGKIGTDWTDEELDGIVALYFDMLGAPPGLPRGWKAERLRGLDAKIGRGTNSIGRKLSNVAFVASTLGIRALPGYGLSPNAQRSALYLAIDRFLSRNLQIWDEQDPRLLPVAQQWGGGPRSGGGALSPPGVAEPSVAFTPSPLLPVTAPPPLGPARTRPEGLQRLVRKFDPAARDARNRVLGRLGEQHVLNHEIARLIAADRMDLAKKVEWTADVHGDGAGYDVRSFEPDGSDRLIEVKATRGGPTTDFFVTRTEREVSQERPDAWRLYRLHDLSATPGVFILPPPLEASVRLEAETWRAGF